MNIRTLKWIQTSKRRVIANRKTVISETWEARTPFVAYKVYSSVAGQCFVVLPNSFDAGGLPGFYPDSLSGPPRRRCASVAEGKRIAETHWTHAVGEEPQL
jgi:hypothetical protein